MIDLYYIWNKRRHGLDCDYIYSSKEEMEERMRGLSTGFKTLDKGENYEIRSMSVNDKCKCDNYMQTTMILLNMCEPGNIKVVGTDNYLGMHRKLRLPFDTDIESYTNGKYQLMSINYFHEHYMIVQSDRGDNI